LILKGIATRFTLGKNDRLKSRKLIGQLFSNGTAISAPPYKLLYSTTPGPATLQAGFAVSSRNFKKAVDRNRIKRLMREAYRLQKNELKKENTAIILFFIYTGKEIMDFKTAESKMSVLIKKLVQQIK
jgi:ribonuclease P protein component